MMRSSFFGFVESIDQAVHEPRPSQDETKIYARKIGFKFSGQSSNCTGSSPTILEVSVFVRFELNGTIHK